MSIYIAAAIFGLSIGSILVSLALALVS